MSVSSTPPFKITIPEKSNAIPLEDINTQLRAEEVNEIGEAINKNALFCGAGYADLSALQTAVPSPAIGSYAYLSSGVKYRCISLGVWSVEPTGSGDMTKAVYDPTNVNSDAFDMDNMVEGSTNKILTQAERDAIAGIGNPTKIVGNWDASSGTFPGGGTAESGDSYIVSVSGTVDGVAFTANDRIIAITDNASTSTFAANWFKADYTDVYQTDAEIETAYNNRVPQVTEPEKTAGTETGIRTFSPEDVKAMVETHGLGGSIVWTKTYVDTTDDLQDIILNCSEYTEIHLLPGVHEYSDTISSNQSLIYITKSNIKIKFHPQAILKLANDTADILDEVEVNTNYFPQVGLNDIEARAIGGGTPEYNLVDALITINGTGTPNTFLVTQFQRHEAPDLTRDGDTIEIVAGQWVAIGAGVEIRFLASTGHTNADVWRIMTSAEAMYPIRIGEGFHEQPIKNISIENAVINGNLTNNNKVHLGVSETGGGIAIFGRVQDVRIYKAEIYDSERPIFIAGRHSGIFNNDGTTTGGESFDVYDVEIDNVYCRDNEAAVLWGHPSYRGFQRNIVLRNSTVVNCYHGEHALEPNHRTNGFLVENCYLKGVNGAEPIHMWRSPENGIIRGNTLNPNTIRDNAPTSWYRASSVNVTIENDKKVLSDPYRDDKEPNSADSALANMIAYYPLATDSNEALGITAGIDGVDTAITYASGEAQLNGTTSYITIPHNDIFSFTDGINDTPYTIALKVKYNDGTSAFLINKGTTDVANREWSIGNAIVNTLNVQNLTDSSNFIDKRKTPWSRSTGVWYHIVATYDGSTLKLYLDGVEQTVNGSTGSYTGMSNHGTGIVIGKTGWTNAHFLNGSVKDVRFYNEAKSDLGVLEITAL